MSELKNIDAFQTRMDDLISQIQKCVADESYENIQSLWSETLDELYKFGELNGFRGGTQQ